jgi:hypothetical protein
MKWRRAKLSETAAVFHKEPPWQTWSRRFVFLVILGSAFFIGLRGLQHEKRLRDYARKFTALERNHRNLRVAFEHLQQRSEKLFWENQVGAQERLQLKKELDNCQNRITHLKEEVAIYRAIGQKSTMPIAIHSFAVKPDDHRYHWRLILVRLDEEKPLRVSLAFQAKGLKDNQPVELGPSNIAPVVVNIAAGIGAFEGHLDLDRSVQWQSITLKIMQGKQELAVASQIL